MHAHGYAHKYAYAYAHENLQDENLQALTRTFALAITRTAHTNETTVLCCSTCITLKPP